MTKPVALSCGEPAGIGPEIAAKAYDALKTTLPLFWIGDPNHLPAGTAWTEIASADETEGAMSKGLPVLRHDFMHPNTFGQANPANAQAVIDVIARGAALVKSGAACALCTAPIHKKALKDGADFAYPGHTEYLQALAGSGQAVMMLASDQLRVVPTTIHIPLDRVASELTPDLLRRTIEITHHGLQTQFGISQPRIAIAGLNPHAGEGGALGTQEMAWINALVDQVASTGINVWGPLPADTLFHARARAQYDVSICMYHDQALIPIKTLDFDRGVNVTLGLPFVRTSPDHGTAFDIAGKGIANPTSMIEAIRMAHRMGHSA